MLKKILKMGIKSIFQTSMRAPLAKTMLGSILSFTRKPGIIFLRCHRLLPQTSKGLAHHNYRSGLALTPVQFEKELLALKQYFSFIDMKGALVQLTSKKRFKATKMVLTFDESYVQTLKLSLPILRRLKIPACMFVTTQNIQTKPHMWNDRVFHLIDDVAPCTVSLPWMDRQLRTKTSNNRIDTFYRILKHLLMYHEDTRKLRLNTFLGGMKAHNKPHPLDNMIKSSHIKSSLNNNVMSFASHSHRHLPLSRLTEHTLSFELNHSREMLADLAGNRFMDVLSYPFGKSSTISNQMVEAAKKAGYKAAFTTSSGFARQANTMFRLPRIRLRQENNNIFAVELNEMVENVANCCKVRLER